MGWDDEVYQRIKTVIEELADVWNNLASWSGIIHIISNVKQLIGAFADVFALIADLWGEFADMPDDEKIDNLAEILDDVVKFPVYLEPFDKMVFAALLKVIFGVFAKKFGANWAAVVSNKLEQIA